MRLRVDIEEIDAQRILGWPDFHPEDYCHRCGGINPVWFTDSTLFNAAMGPPVEHKWYGIVCPGCFAQLYEQATGTICVWELVQDSRREAGQP